MDTIKDKNSKDIAEAEEINKSWQEYPEELYKIGLKDPDNHSVDILPSWSVKSSGP